jgi:hypothetical protein
LERERISAPRARIKPENRPTELQMLRFHFLLYVAVSLRYRRVFFSTRLFYGRTEDFCCSCLWRGFTSLV